MRENPSSFSIKHWSNEDKPREKLALKGRLALSDAELIAILIGSGTKAETAVGLAKRILAAAHNNLNELGKLSLKQLMDFKGIGEAKAITIAAALEIGRRRREEAPQKITKIINSESVFQILQPYMGELSHEEFWILYLNNSNKILHMGQLSKGGITGTLVDVRLVLKQALELGAVALVLAHNHPSGGLSPSKADKMVTQKIKTAADTVDIKILDHVIITQEDYFSFADNAIL
ncbi:MAG: DNA repair protein RadC [Sediminicola sp.]|tara:strand:+ start:96716 stop:97414 length:699 start_codon:yes stop_codon:yes gene_type:complete